MRVSASKISGKCLLLPALFIVAGLGSPAASQSAPPAQQAPATQTIAEHAFKNVQVLKGIPSDQLISSMQFISASLGVECGFCHVENHFDQDDKKPKLIARKMMLMMSTINQNNFDGHREVTCNTCHRGTRVPEGIPAISETPPGPRMQGSKDEQSLAGLPSADELLRKYVAASGGEKALQKISTREAKGTANFMGREVPIDIYDKAPDRRASYMHLPNGDSATVFDGQQGWTGSSQFVRGIPPSELEGAKIDADMQLPLHLQQMFPDLHPAKQERVGGRETYQLLSENAGQPRIRLFFDSETGLLLRMIRYANSPLGMNPVRVDYSDYRPVDGIQVPYRWTVARPSGQFAIQITEVKQNVEIDDSKFSKPATPQNAANRP